MKILIVEDSQTQAERLKHILEQDGYQIDIAVNGLDALNKLAESKPDLVISDIVMPEMDGYEFCRRIRLNPHFKNTPVILLSTLSEVEDIVSGLESGANYIITKPYNDEYLLKHLHAAIDIQKIRQTETEDKDIKILINGHVHTINVKKSQILDFLLSIYDAAVHKHAELHRTRMQLQDLNNILERKVEERTTALRVESEERKRYEKQFMESQKLETIGQLTGGIAHDFNNLLMIMQGNLEMMKLGQEIDKKNSARLDEALAAMSRAADLIKRLMAFSRRQQLQPNLLNLRYLITNIIKLLRPMLGESIEIKMDIPNDIWPVFIDPNQFENVLINLAVNARDAMKEQGKLTIEVRNLTLNEMVATKKYNIAPGDYVKISVSDNGEGIPPEILDRVFEPFFTTKETGKGTGLGLSMVYGFIKQSMGHATIYSEVGHGTTVNLYLPRATETQLTETGPQNKSVTELNGKEKILLVEDEASLRKVTAEYLISLGYSVLQAENGTAAFEILQKEKGIKLLLTDVVMPGKLLGADLAEMALKNDPKLKVIFVSGYPKNVLLGNKKLKDKDQVLLTKPYSMVDLIRVVRNVLDGH